MSKNKKKKKGGYKPPAISVQDTIDEIVSLSQQIFSTEEPGALWGQLHKLFLKSTVDPNVAAKIIMHKDVDELQQVLDQLQHGEEATIENKQKDEPLPELSHETKKQAMRMFRKRVKFIKLDRESKLGIGPLTTGKEATFDSVEAPHDYPSEVWKVLAAEGQLVDDGDGFYRLP
ncbi:MAG: hypothetical protein H8E91_07005 [Planctomycetes bacterium]|nr:hypothetical protein [Planctomycetota bacterium]MBL6998161.1 hypothetical protein [Phycisphaerales bacterium]